MTPPEEIKKKVGEVVKSTPDDAVVGFFSMDGAAAGIQASMFDVKEEVETTIQHIRDADAKISLAGLRHFRTIMKDVAQANGLVGKVSEVHNATNPDGTPVRRVLSTQTLLHRLQEAPNSGQEDNDAQNRIEHYTTKEEEEATSDDCSTSRGLPEHADSDATESARSADSTGHGFAGSSEGLEQEPGGSGDEGS
jgi:hypothetical protein